MRSSETSGFCQWSYRAVEEPFYLAASHKKFQKCADRLQTDRDQHLDACHREPSPRAIAP
jgi:hypothetical protein